MEKSLTWTPSGSARLGLAVAVALLTAPAMAATETANINVTATVTGVCTITGGSMNFSGNRTTNTNIDGSVAIGHQCTNGLSATIGTTPDGDYASNNMWYAKSGSNFVPVFLAWDSAHSDPFQPGSNKTVTGTGLSETTNVYGRIQAGALAGVPAGTYTTTVPITITYTP